MNRTLLSVATLTAALVAGVASAAEPQAKPVAVVAVSGYGEVMDDIRYLGKLGGDPLMADRLELVLQLFTRKKGLAGLDKSRPWGAAMTTDGLEFNMRAFLPVTDFDELLESLVFFIGDPEDAGDGMWEIEVESVPLYVKEHNGWAYVTRIPESLDELPDDPVALLDGLHDKYDLSARVYPQNMPENFREVAAGMIDQYLGYALQEPSEGETADEFAARKRGTTEMVKRYAQIAAQLDEFTLGFAVDQKTKQARIDVDLLAPPGSPLAKTLVGMSKPSASKFSGFERADAAMKFSLTGDLTPQQTQQTVTLVEGLRDTLAKRIDAGLKPEAQAVVRPMLDSLFDMVTANAKAGRRDLAVAALGKGPYTIVAGGQAADSASLKSCVDQFFQTIDGQPGFEKIERGTTQHKGIVFHSVLATIPEDCDCLFDVPAAAATDKPAAAAAGKADDRKNAKAAPGEEKDEPIDDADDLRRLVERGESPADQLRLMLREARVCFGEQAPLVIGIGPDAGYLAFGPDAQAKLIEIIDASAAADKPAAPVSFSMCPWPFIKSAAEADPDNLLLAMYANSPSATSTDRVHLTVVPRENGVMYRVEADEGVLPLMGILAAMSAAAGGLGGF